MSALLYTFEAYRLVLRALVLLMSVHFVLATFGYLRRKRPATPAPPAEWPRVTVQLPIRNEFFAAPRVIRAAAALDYPRDRLEIQVLDDSDDATVTLIVSEVARQREAGLNVVHLRRFAPTDFKAGALAYGTALAQGDLLAIFDADFVPAKDFLRKTVPHFHDPKVALVQGRWEHENRGDSWFTRLQAQILDGLMVVEQTAKSDAGLPFQFNGTAGVWRKGAIAAAGGWTFDSLTEDFDLSLRVQLAGWRLVHLPEVAVPSRLPTTLGLFRVQQRRWALGTAQLLGKRLGAIVAADLSVGARLSVLFQLFRHFGYPLLVLMVLTVPLTTFAFVVTPIEYGLGNAFVLGVAVSSIAFQQIVAERAIGRSALAALLLSPLSVALAIGLAPTYTVALWYGLRDRAGAFHRTPKVLRTPAPGEPVYRAQRSVLVAVEIAVGLAYLAFTVLAAERDLWMESAFLAFVAGSYLWVGIGSLHVNGLPREAA